MTAPRIDGIHRVRKENIMASGICLAIAIIILKMVLLRPKFTTFQIPDNFDFRKF